MSKFELHYLYELEWSDVVTDIREQYPLHPLGKTIVKHDEFYLFSMS